MWTKVYFSRWGYTSLRKRRGDGGRRSIGDRWEEKRKGERVKKSRERRQTRSWNKWGFIFTHHQKGTLWQVWWKWETVCLTPQRMVELPWQQLPPCLPVQRDERGWSTHPSLSHSLVAGRHGNPVQAAAKKKRKGFMARKNRESSKEEG